MVETIPAETVNWEKGQLKSSPFQELRNYALNSYTGLLFTY